MLGGTKRSTLVLPLSGERLVCSAVGWHSVRSLKTLARLLELTCTDDQIEPDVILSDKTLAHETKFDLSKTGMPSFFLLNSGAFGIVKEAGWPLYLACDWGMLLVLGCLRKMLNGSFIGLLHGALLEYSEQQGVVVFGPSGVGKSTTVNRFRAAGGRARADDILLLCWQDNRLMAYPLPTRSWYSAHWSRRLRYPFLPGVKVEKLLQLSRGKNAEALVEVPNSQWFAGLVEAMTMHCSFYASRFTAGAKKQYGEQLLNLAEKIADAYPPLELRANLSANIVDTLNCREWMGKC